MVTKLQSSLEQKGPATQRKGKLLLSQCLLLSSRRIKCRNKSHQRLRQFLSPRENWLTTKPRRNNFTWSKSDHKISRLRKARRLTCPRSQLMAHYEAKRKVHRPEYYGLTPHQKWMIRQLENFHIIINSMARSTSATLRQKALEIWEIILSNQGWLTQNGYRKRRTK